MNYTAENNEGVVQCIDPPSPPTAPLPPAQPPSNPPPAPPPDTTGCDELKRRWDISIARARDDYDNHPTYPYADAELHNYAFSRSCWQYSHNSAVNGAVANAYDECENRIEQKGYTSLWWTYSWENANSAAYRFDGPNGAALNTWVEQGYYSLCKMKADGKTCAPANDGAVGADYFVFLEPNHPSYFPPNQEEIDEVVPTAPEIAICKAQGAYSPVLTFPPNGNQPSSSENRLIETPSVTITPVSPPPPPAPPVLPPPPESPPTPPTPPPPPIYNVELILNDPVIAFAACLQTNSITPYREDVETLEECASAMNDLGMTSIPELGGAYESGYRCHSNASGIFVWAVPPTPSPSRAYMCRYGGAPAPTRRKLSVAVSPSPRFSGWVDGKGYFYSSQLHAANASYEEFLPRINVTGTNEFWKTDIAFLMHPLCGRICVVDDRLHRYQYVYYKGEQCMPVREALSYFLDDDRC